MIKNFSDPWYGMSKFSTIMCIHNVVYFATYVFITNKKLVKLQYVVVSYGGMIPFHYDNSIRLLLGNVSFLFFWGGPKLAIVTVLLTQTYNF